MSYILISCGPLAAFTFTAANLVGTQFQDIRRQELINQANRIAGSVVKAKYMTDETKVVMFTTEIDNKSSAGGFRIIVIDSMLTVVGDSSHVEVGNLLVLPDVIKAFDMKKDQTSIQEQDLTITAIANMFDGETHLGAVMIIEDISDIRTMTNMITRTLLFTFFPTSVAVILMVSFFITPIFTSPLKKILDAVQKMTDGQLHQRIPTHGRDEFAEISEAFNDMSAKLESVEVSRSEFVSNVSHELKTPISSMKVLSESLLLMEGAPTTLYIDFLRDISSEIDRMTQIINELLVLVKLDQTELSLNLAGFSPNEMVEGLLKRLSPLAEQKKIELIYDPVKTTQIEADEMKLSLAISNLIENAIKYTPEGGTVKVTVDSDNQNTFITVQDNGIGIAEEDQQKVFIRFFRADKTRDRETGGTGLGLAITHKTVLLHNGSIKLQSKEGKGSTFVVRIPTHSA